MAYDERGERRSSFSSTRKVIRGVETWSDLVITSEECAKEVVFSHFGCIVTLIMCVMMMITLAHLTLCVVRVR